MIKPADTKGRQPRASEIVLKLLPSCGHAGRFEAQLLMSSTATWPPGWSATSANTVLSITGATVSGLFLLTIGVYNAAAFRRTAMLYRRVKDGATVNREALAPTGLVARLLDKPLSRVNRPRDIFVLGFLFGLGFDTASTIAFLLITATAALAGISRLRLWPCLSALWRR